MLFLYKYQLQKFHEKSRNVKCMAFCIKKRNGNCLAFWKVSGFLYIKTFRNFFAFCVYKRSRCLSMMAVIIIFIRIHKPFFFAFCLYKNVSQKKLFFVYEWKLWPLPSSKDNAHVYIHKKQKNCRTFLYTKRQTLFKKLYNFRYVFLIQKAIHLTLRDYNEIFEVGIYAKSMTLCVTWRF